MPKFVSVIWPWCMYNVCSVRGDLTLACFVVHVCRSELENRLTTICKLTFTHQQQLDFLPSHCVWNVWYRRRSKNAQLYTICNPHQTNDHTLRLFRFHVKNSNFAYDQPAKGIRRHLKPCTKSANIPGVVIKAGRKIWTLLQNGRRNVSPLLPLSIQFIYLLTCNKLSKSKTYLCVSQMYFAIIQ
jgi:hypothetical protein